MLSTDTNGVLGVFTLVVVKVFAIIYLQ